MWGIQLEQTARVDMLHVPFRGSPAAANALFGNQIDLMFMSPAQALPSEKSGKVKIIGSTAGKRVAAWSHVPTLAEQGFTGYEGSTGSACSRRRRCRPTSSTCSIASSTPCCRRRRRWRSSPRWR
ncbi:hypothetical protein HK414_06350 [Ramlibacter terrae]|uniref:SsuA/THI5-like domain-containing protein n=1 Tax=Ramlibacter terrae TaxID=2732511 RepID=A0ABX6P9I7_9BURK|nr:hypothetical protein HK414_06350 [Ramlibacter terrae]